MNLTHLHLALNHLPVLGPAFALALLLFGVWRKSEDIKKAALGAFVLIALFSVPAYMTGEPAEDGVKGLPGVSKQIIEKHEEAASVAFTGLVVIGVVALVGLLVFRRARPVPSWFSSLVLAVALIVVSLMSWTANLGGQIRHTEIRSNSGPAGGQQ